MRVLVTGAAGFVGSHLVQALLDRGDDVCGFDRKKTHDVKGMTITGDLTDPEVARMGVAAFAPDVVVHLAATCSTPASIRDPLTTFRDTVVTAVNILDAVREAQIPTIVVSSVKARDGATPYGAAKRMVETWATEYDAAFGVPIVIDRPGTIYGPGQEGSEDSGWIAWFCKARAEGLPVVVNGSGEQIRDLLHVSDMVRLLVTQVHDFSRYEGVIWDVGGGIQNAVSVNHIVEHLGLEVTYGPSRYGDVGRYVAMNGVPGWEPKVVWYESETLA